MTDDFKIKPRKKKERGLVCGWGINDADFCTSYRDSGKMRHHPAYQAWFNMINRVYGKNPGAYAGCTISKEWQKFSRFLEWWVINHQEGFQLDKDILYPGNKEYGPDFCIYVPAWMNAKDAQSRRERDSLPGVTFDHRLGKYKAQRDGGNDRYLGYFDSADLAHKAWLEDGGQERRDIWLKELADIRNKKSI